MTTIAPTIAPRRAPARRALMCTALAAAALLATACTGAPTAPVVSPTRSAAPVKLVPTGNALTGKSGYMLSSGLDDSEDGHTK